MTTLIQDLRYGLRVLRKNPGFTAVAVLTLALGIGPNTAIFSVMNALVLRYLPVPNPRQLVYLNETTWPSGAFQTGSGGLSFPEHTFEELRTQRQVFSDLMAFVPLNFDKVAIRFGEEPEEARAEMVSGNFFSGLGVRPASGRTFTPEDERQHTPVAVLSYAYWTRRFSRNPSVIGQTLYIKGLPFTISGVASRDFWGVEPGKPTDVWIPLQNRPDVTAWGMSTQDGTSLYGTPNWWCLMMIGRLQPGVGRQRALALLTPLFQRSAYEGIGTRDPKERPPELYFSSARGMEMWGGGWQPLKMLMAMVGLVLIIACTNVAMLVLARNSARQREFCLRAALGASRGRIFRQLLAESMLLVAAGTTLGWIIAMWASDALAAWGKSALSAAPDRTVLFFTLAVSLLVGIVFGLTPLRSATSAQPGLALKTSPMVTGQGREKSLGGRVLVGFQVAMCFVLLVGAGLLFRTLQNLETLNLGLRTRGLLVFGISPPPTAHTDAEGLLFFRTLMDRLRVLPGVESATVMENRLGSGWSNNTDAVVDGRNPRGEVESAMRWNAVGPDYFHVLGTPLVLGRDFTDADSAGAPNVAIISQTFATRYLAGRDPLGHSVALSLNGKTAQYTVVGVAADSKYTGAREAGVPMAYFPYSQVPGVTTMAMHFELRTEAEPARLWPEVRRAAQALGPDLPLLQPMTQQQQFQESYSNERQFAQLSVLFGLLATLLVATGLYGTLSYQVSRRTAEIGVRMALGAERPQVLWMMLRESLLVSSAGALIGLPIAFAGGRLLRSMLFGIGPDDPLTFAGALAGIILVTLAASYMPARRATKVDPLEALRYE